MTAELLDDIVHALDQAADPVEPTCMFGSDRYPVSCKTFAMVVRGAIVTKLPATRVDELSA